MEPAEVVERYRRLAALVERMVELARERRWALLPALDADCADLFEQLREAPLDGIPPSELQELEALASRIEWDQQRLNALVRPQFAQLVDRLGQTSAA